MIKKSMYLIVSLLMIGTLGMMRVGATSVSIDTNDYIELSPYIFSDTNTTFKVSSQLSSYTSYYQLVDVSTDATLVEKIDELMQSYGILSDINSKISTASDSEKADLEEERTIIDESITDLKAQINASVDDYNDSNWVAATNNTIPNTYVTKGNYYAVWVKVEAGSDTYYDLEVTQAVSSSDVDVSSLSNPDTGIRETILYIGVGLLVIAGSYLVINKNKERYE